MSEELLPDVPSQDIGNSAPVESAPSHSEPAASNVYDAFRSLPDFEGQDDVAIAQNLYRSHTGYQESQRALQQYQSVVPYAQEYLKNQGQFEAWKRSQAEERTRASAPAPAAKWWAPPEVKDGWKSYIVRDPQTGREVISPEAPFEAQQGLREFQTYTSDFARKLVTDPEKTLQPFIEQIAQSKAMEMVEQHLGQYKSQNYVQSLEQQNADWLYDGQGNVSREGQAIQGYIKQASEFGIQSPDARWKYATGMLQRDLLNTRYQQMGQQSAQMQQYITAQQAQAQQAPQADPVATANMEFMRERATRTPNRSAGSTEPRAPRSRMSFEDRLKSQLTSDGVL